MILLTICAGREEEEEETEEEEEEEEEEYKSYKGRTNSNSPTRPNEAVYLATLLLNIYLIDKRIAKWKVPPHPPFPPSKAGRKKK